MYVKTKGCINRKHWTFLALTLNFLRYGLWQYWTRYFYSRNPPQQESYAWKGGCKIHKDYACLTVCFLTVVYCKCTMRFNFDEYLGWRNIVGAIFAVFAPPLSYMRVVRRGSLKVRLASHQAFPPTQPRMGARRTAMAGTRPAPHIFPPFPGSHVYLRFTLYPNRYTIVLLYSTHSLLFKHAGRRDRRRLRWEQQSTEAVSGHTDSVNSGWQREDTVKPAYGK